jgi:hypothetical protein
MSQLVEVRQYQDIVEHLPAPISGLFANPPAVAQ